MATRGAATDEPATAPNHGLGWWNWPLQAWPALAPQQLSQPINPDWSLVRITNLNSSAPEVERQVLAQQSYGRQIGKLLDAVSALVERLPPAAAKDERIEAFVKLAQAVEQIKNDARRPRLERLRDEIEDLRRTDEPAYQQLRSMLDR